MFGNELNGNFSNMFEEIQNFEYNLNRIVPMEKLNIRTFASLRTATRFNWIELMNTIAFYSNSSYTFTEDDQLVIQNLPYLLRLSHLLSSYSRRTILNYIGFTFVFAHIHEHQQLPTCFDLFKTQPFNLMSLRIYLLHQSNGDLNYYESIRSSIIKINSDITETFVDRLFDYEQYSWIDEKTRAWVIDKLHSINYTIGYPDWLIDDQQTDFHFGLKNKRLLFNGSAGLIENFYQWMTIWNRIQWQFFYQTDTSQ